MPISERMLAFFPLAPEYGFQNESRYRNRLKYLEHKHVHFAPGPDLVYFEGFYDKLHSLGLDQSTLPKLDMSLYAGSGDAIFRLSAPLFVSDASSGGWLSQPVYHPQIAISLMSLIHPQAKTVYPRYGFGNYGPFDVLDQLGQYERIQQLYHPGLTEPKFAHNLSVEGRHQYDMVHHDLFHLYKNMATESVGLNLTAYTVQHLLKLRMFVSDPLLVRMIDNAQLGDVLTHPSTENPEKQLRRLFNIVSEWLYPSSFRSSHIFIYICLVCHPDVKELIRKVPQDKVEEIRSDLSSGAAGYHDKLLEAVLEEFDNPLQVYSAKNLIRRTMSLCNLAPDEKAKLFTEKMIYMLSSYDLEYLSCHHSEAVFLHKIFGEIDMIYENELSRYRKQKHNFGLKPKLKEYIENHFGVSIDQMHEEKHIKQPLMT